MQKLKAFGLLLVILLALVPVYAGHQWLQRRIRPRASGGRLLLYLLISLLFIFLYVFLIVFAFANLLPAASR